MRARTEFGSVRGRHGCRHQLYSGLDEVQRQLVYVVVLRGRNWGVDCCRVVCFARHDVPLPLPPLFCAKYSKQRL